jgi:hypothetical protein
MSSKRTIKKKTKKGAVKSRGKGTSRVHGSNGRGITRVHGNGEDYLPDVGFSFDDYPSPTYLNPESPEEREKRLLSRKALTLRAFRTTYENRRRKAS